MSKEFKIKINKDIRINIEPLKLKKIILKIKGKNEKNEIFNAHITIKFNNKSNKITVKKINISKLEIENSSDEFSYLEYRNIYNNNIHNLISSSSSSSSSSSCKDKNLTNIYNHLITFTKNIKLLTKNNKINGLFLSLKNSDIKKMKLRCKLI